MHSMKRDNVKCNVKFCVIICLDLKDGLTCTKVIPVVEFQRRGSLLERILELWKNRAMQGGKWGNVGNKAMNYKWAVTSYSR